MSKAVTIISQRTAKVAGQDAPSRIHALNVQGQSDQETVLPIFFGNDEVRPKSLTFSGLGRIG